MIKITKKLTATIIAAMLVFSSSVYAAAADSAAFIGSTELSQYLYTQFSKNASTLSVPVELFSSKQTKQRFDELGKAAIEAYIQNGLTDYVVDFKYSYTDGSPNMTLNVTYSNNDSKSRQANGKALDKKADEIVTKLITPEMTQRQKAETLSNYVAQNVKYDFSAFKDFQAGENVYEKQTAYSALVEQNSICQGFARAYKLLCDKAGVPCTVLFGTTKQFGTTHAWNRVQLDGVWQTVDTSNAQLAINHVGSFCIPENIVTATLIPDIEKTLITSPF